MAKEIKVTFDDGGVYEGFANTYTLNNAITYYFSFDRDYRVQVTGNAITLQEYRNAGAWYPIDIITAFEVSEISGGGSGDVTKEWVQDNFVLKSGDTMTGALKFDFGSGVVFRIEHGSTTNRAQVTLNGGIILENDNKQRTFSVISTDKSASINLYKVDNYNGTIWFRGHEYGGSGNYRAIAYNAIINSDTNNTWLMNGKFQTNNNWFFKAGVYFDAWAYWRSNDIINHIIANNGQLMSFNGNNHILHSGAYQAENNYYTSYKYNGMTTFSNIGGQNPIYRIDSYTNFVKSVECYDKITVKTEGQDTARLILSKGYLNTYNDSNIRRVFIGNSISAYDNNKTLQYNIQGSRFDIYNGNAVICHKGNDGGTTDAQIAYKYSGLETYNYTNDTMYIKNASGSITIESDMGNLATAIRIYTPGAHYSFTESAGTVTGTGLYTTCYNTYYSESMLNALNTCLGHIFDELGKKWYVQFSGTDYSTGGGKSRGGGVGRR